MAVRQELLEKLKESEELQFTIAKGMKKKFRTIEKWVKTNDEMLSSKAVVLIIKDATGLSEEEILEQETATA